jgi:hypothetical protein
MEPHVQHHGQAGGHRTSPASTAPIETGISNLSLEAAAASRLEHDRGSTTTHSTGERTVEVSNKMQNRAAQGNSPYVQSHASSPVKWQLLDAEAVNRAKRENKLIFLNVGFKACHCTYDQRIGGP